MLVYFWIVVGKLAAILSDAPELAAGLYSSVSTWSVHAAHFIAACAVHVYSFLATCVGHVAAGLMALASVIQHLGLSTAGYYQVSQWKYIELFFVDFQFCFLPGESEESSIDILHGQTNAHIQIRSPSS